MAKKVYADYHGPRCTREHDGKVAQWKYFGTAKKSRAGQTCVNYNADCILDSGLADVAALSYPLVGMQSQRDAAYIEYQILTARLAHIDGFFVEWGFKEHESNEELLIMMEQARRLDFEIGINWCDAWHFYDWIEAFHPDAADRERKVELFTENLQYLLDTLYSVKTGAKWDGHPLIFLFGGGPDVKEFQKIRQEAYRLPAETGTPLFFTRAPVLGEEKDGKVSYFVEKDSWADVTDGIFGWIPTRVRNGLDTEEFQSWDRYATREDALAYLEALREGMRQRGSRVRIGCVNPEMDNRACASWNKHDLSCIPREKGATYEEMWKSNVEHREDTDIVYIVSWNDYTERHQIEPTLKDGYREVLTTAKYAALFKEIQENDAEAFEIPLRLFHMRKKLGKLERAGYDVKPYSRVLDEIALDIRDGRVSVAGLSLSGTEKLLETLEKRLLTASALYTQERGELCVESGGIRILSREALYYMERWGYDAWLCFSYYEEAKENFRLFHGQQELCDIRMDGTKVWKQAKIPVFQANIKGIEEDAFFRAEGAAQIKSVSLQIEAYRNWKGQE